MLTDELRSALHHLNSGRPDQAEQICTQLLGRDGGNALALCVMGTVANGRGHFSKALAHGEHALASGGRLPQIHLMMAYAHRGRGERAAAIKSAEQGVALAPNVPNGYLLIAELKYPGENYHGLLGRLHQFLKPRSYVEIGVNAGASLALAKPPTVAVGIDPEPVITKTFTAKTKVVRLPSDDYFATRDVRADMECDVIDMAFLDGLHVFEQTLRDFINVERFAAPQTVVTIHDCLPIDRLTAERERQTSFWTGDIWKVPLCLKEKRPDLDVRLVPTHPTGLCIVRGLDPASTVLTEQLQQIYAEYVDLDFDAAAERLRSLRSLENSWPTIEAALTAPLHA